MRLFALSTAETGTGMALFEGPDLVCESYWAGSQSHSKRLLTMVAQMVVDQAGLTMQEIDGFIAARGPGSFTGLRIGISVVKGMAAAMAKPCAGVSSLDGVAFRFSSASVPVCVMMDARRQEVYTACYRFNRGVLVEKSPEQVCAPEAAIKSAGPDVLFAGSGSKAYLDMIRDLSGAASQVAPSYMDAVSAAALAAPALADPLFFTSGRHELVPAYLRQSDAQIHLSQKSIS
ncbi:MAG: tRNA (adenosine(37)-N6)-threonylcarbamoyltransferase complex dimerization subunit type 1 TsaB [Desulfobacterales bacterium]|nr:MAG: tRNA (adenosine(37)-N6)-threonylcarbamoyltransferase complex dimerization subunit type 1 TsaB [Desulfobacterales bacterium]